MYIFFQEIYIKEKCKKYENSLTSHKDQGNSDFKSKINREIARPATRVYTRQSRTQ